jgi:poly(3-hydroxybutyrate) depolymerase
MFIHALPRNCSRLMPPLSGRAPLLLATFVAIALLLCAGSSQSKAQGSALPALGADLEATTVSGLSSGAFMASQFHIAHSRIVRGAAIVAGGPYGCAENAYPFPWKGPGASASLLAVVAGCMSHSTPGVPATGFLEGRITILAAEGRIDPISDLSRSRVYLFSGYKDHVVVPAIVAATRRLYASLGVRRFRDRSGGAGHGFITETKGIACGETGSPYVNHCQYDQAGDLLDHLYGALKPRSKSPASEFLVFDQSRFVQGLAEHGLDAAGVAYVPADCRATAGCRVHVVFHGCEQQRSKPEIVDTFIKDSGFAEWADSNRLILLFPQVLAGTFNPKGCWDWWGYTGTDYFTRSAPQIAAVKRMLDRLAQAPGSN